MGRLSHKAKSFAFYRPDDAQLYGPNEQFYKEFLEINSVKCSADFFRTSTEAKDSMARHLGITGGI